MATHRRKIVEEKTTPLDRLSDWITSFTGSWTFILLHIVWFIVWFWLDLGVDHLTLILSVEAIILATFILMSGKRQEARDDARDDADYQADIQAEVEIHEVKKMLERIEKRLK